MPKKPISPYKLASLPEWQQQRIKADEAKAKTAQVQGSSLKTFSPKRLAKMGGKTLYSSFSSNPDSRPLQRKHLVNGLSVKTITRQPMAKGKPLRYQGRRGRRLQQQRNPWREAIFAIHGRRCLYPGCHSTGPYDAMHAYGKQAHPEWHAEVWNGFPACRNHHTGGTKGTFEFDPVLRQALQMCADEMRAALDERRPQPSFEELQDIIAKEMGL